MYALMIYFWSTHADSAKRQTVDTVLDDYLKTKDADIAKLLSVTKKGKFLNIDGDIETALKGACQGTSCFGVTQLPRKLILHESVA